MPAPLQERIIGSVSLLRWHPWSAWSARGLLVLVATLTVATVAPAVGSSASAVGPAAADPVVPGGTTFVANLSTNSITEYRAGDVGNVAPVTTISGSNTGLNVPQDAILAASGTLFVSNFGGQSITEYAPGAAGDVAPIATIAGSNTQLGAPEGMVLAPTGDLIVANNNNSVTEYAPQVTGLDGNLAPIATIAGSNTKLSEPRGVLIGPTGTLFVANLLNNSITEYTPGTSGNVAPIATISGSNTQLGEPEGLALGPTGDLLVANFSSNSVTEYAPGASGNVAPTAVVQGADTGLKAPVGLAVGPTGDLSVSNETGNSVTRYARGATGDATPITTISGTNTGLDSPRGMAVALPEPYHPLTPARITDTRSGSGFPNAGHTLGPGTTLDVQVTGAGGVPATGVAAAVLNVTATNPTEQSFLTIWPTGVSRPTASNLNFGPGRTVPNLGEVGLGTNGKVSVFNPAGSVDVVVDVEGYVGPAAAGTGLYHPLAPARITDTRLNSGFPNSGDTLGPGGTLNVQVTAEGGVPASGVGAVVLNVTATNPTASSFLTVWPTGASRPTASNVNFVAGQTVPNRVQVPVGTGGKVSIFNATGSVDVVVDVGGHFTDSTDPSAIGAQFVPTTPARITDTRANSGSPNAGHTLGPGGSVVVVVRGAGGVAADAVAGVLNVTVTDATKSSVLTVFPNAFPRPTASDLNWVAGETVANLTVAEAGRDGAIVAFNAAGSVDVVVDVSGSYS
jgi:hypothetical protein